MEKLSLPVVIEKDADGYFAYCPQLQACYTQGDTYGEALENIRDAIGLHIEDRLADGESLPELEAVSVTAVEIPDEKLTEDEDDLMLANPRIMAEIREAQMEYEAGECAKSDESRGELADSENTDV